MSGLLAHIGPLALKKSDEPRSLIIFASSNWLLAPLGVSLASVATLSFITSRGAHLTPEKKDLAQSADRLCSGEGLLVEDFAGGHDRP